MLAIGRILRTGRQAAPARRADRRAGAGDHRADRPPAIQALKARGYTVLLVEQNFRFAATVADRFYVMEHGRIVETIPRGQLEARMDMLHEYLGV